MLNVQGPVYQCAANFSEGRRPEVIQAIRQAATDAPGAVVADCSHDEDHHRMVVTILGAGDAVHDAAVASARAAVAAIDLRRHTGAHPRIGAVDVVPVTPLRNATMADARVVAERIAHSFASLLDLPVYLYERSARPDRRSLLPDLRRGGFEGLFAGRLEGDRAPDLGPAAPHPSAGIAVVGARGPLIAYNVNVAGSHVAAVKAVAAGIRAARGTDPALSGVRALGLALPRAGKTQVSMNLTTPDSPTLPAVYSRVSELLARHGLTPLESEVIGLIPARGLGDAAPADILWRDYRVTQILEHWLGEPLPAHLQR